MNKPNCYECIHRRPLMGDAHSMCAHSNMGSSKEDIFNIQANRHAVENGWFYWPYNYDPVWLENCDQFTQKESKSDDDNDRI